MGEWDTEVSGPRMVMVTHPDGHRWFFRFPEGWTAGSVPQYDATSWAFGEQPDGPLLNDNAAAMAEKRAVREGWIEVPS